MPNWIQVEIEKAAGITPELAEFVNYHRNLPEVKTMIDLLQLQVEVYEPAGFALLKVAVERVRKLLETSSPSRPTDPRGRPSGLP
jgi:hypothetical protein